MQYLGGKSRIAKDVAASVNAIRRGRPVWDPFCGGLSVSVALGGQILCTDAHPALIALYQAVATGWDPPARLTEAEYAAARALPDTDPLKAFAGFGCSFGGKWFGGYARPDDNAPNRNFADTARRALLRDVGALVARGCEFARVDFLAIEPHPVDAVLYADPSYAGTTKYSLCFDSRVFYARVAAWARHTDVVVSEYAMPWGRVLWERPVRMSVAGGNSALGARTERLYRYGPDRLLDQVML